MRFPRVFCVALSIWVAAACNAEAQSKSSHALIAELVLSTDDLGATEKRLRDRKVDEVHQASTVGRDVYLGAWALVGGCVEVVARCRVLVRFALLKPGGALHYVSPQMDTVVPDSSSTLTLSKNNLAVIFKDYDPLGRWTVMMLIHDENSGERLSIAREVTVE